MGSFTLLYRDTHGQGQVKIWLLPAYKFTMVLKERRRERTRDFHRNRKRGEREKERDIYHREKEIGRGSLFLSVCPLILTEAAVSHVIEAMILITEAYYMQWFL